MSEVTLCVVPTTEDRRLCKAITKAVANPDDPPDADGGVVEVRPDELPYRCNFEECSVGSIEALHGLLLQLAKRPDTCVLRAHPLTSYGRRLLHPDPDTGDEPTLADVPRAWVCIDLDSVATPAGLSFCEQPHECALSMRERLPAEFRGAACVWRASSSAGFKPGVRLHLWFLLTRPVSSGELEHWLRDVPCDPAAFRPNQPVFTADPLFVGAVRDPMVARIGMLGGNAKVHVPAVLTAVESTPLRERSALSDDPLKAAALARWEAKHPWEPERGRSARYECPACGSSDGIAVRADGRWNCHSSKHADLAPDIGTYTGSVYVGHRIEFQLGLSAREVIPTLKSGGYWLTPKLPAHFHPAEHPAAPVGVTVQVPPGSLNPTSLTAEPTGLGGSPVRLDSKTEDLSVNPTGGSVGAVVSLGAYRAARAVSEDPDIPETADGKKYARGTATLRSLCFRTEAIRNAVAYDERSRLVVLHAPPPWRPDDRRVFPRVLSDTDATDLCQYVHEATGYAYATRTDAVACLNTLAYENAFDPVRDYLDGLQWTGTVGDAWHLLARVPGELLGVETTPGTADGYTAAAFARWCIAAVQRTYEPGCQFREVLTLIGPQAVGKSQFLRALCADPAWFSDTVNGGSDKDSRSALDGTWIVEFAELDKHMREDRTGSFKNFISTQVDRYRRSYAAADGAYRRRCVFAATSNYPDLFVDSSGNSRFNVLTVRSVDLSGTLRLRDNLWAAARELYRAGEPAYLQPSEIATARAVQAAHYNQNTVEALITELWEAPAPTEQRRPGVRDDVGFSWHPMQIGADGLWCVLTTEQMRAHLRVKGYTLNVDRMIRSACRSMSLLCGRMPRELDPAQSRAWERPGLRPNILTSAGR